MKVYYDTEFLEDGRTIELISIGMVREDGEEYYAIHAGMPWREIWRHEWLRQNVVPYLPTKSGMIVHPNGYEEPYRYLDVSKPEVKSKTTIKHEVEKFLHDAHVPDNSLELWGWYSSYDHVVLAQLFGKMIDLPKFVPMWTNDIRQEFRRFGNPSFRPPVNIKHHALADAQHNKKLHEFIIDYEHNKKLSEHEPSIPTQK